MRKKLHLSLMRLYRYLWRAFLAWPRRKDGYVKFPIAYEFFRAFTESVCHVARYVLR